MIVRTIVPVVQQDNLCGDGASEFGLGDTVQSIFFSPKAPTRGGPIGRRPGVYLSEGNKPVYRRLQMGVGPAIVVLKQMGPITVGALANHIWSAAGSGNRPDISATFLQPFVSYTTRKASGWGEAQPDE